MPKLKARKLTDAILDQLKPGEHADGGVAAPLYFRVTGDKRRWELRYRAAAPDGSRRQVRELLGLYPQLTLSKARAAAVTRMASVSQQAEQEQTELADVVTVAHLWDRYREHRLSQLAERTRGEYIRLYAGDIAPGMASRRLDRVTTREVSQLIEQVQRRARTGGRADARGTIAARTRTVLSQMFGYAVELGLIEQNPVAGAVRVKSGPSRAIRAQLSERDRDPAAVVPVDRVWAAVSGVRSPATRTALQLALLLGLRASEATGLTWDRVDLDARALTITGKGSKTRTVPLSGAAATILRARKAETEAAARQARETDAESGPTPAPPCAVRSDSLPQAMYRLGLGLTAHDLRRTCATGLAALGASREAVARLLGHTVTDVTGIYDRHDRQDELRDKLNEWAGRVVPQAEQPAPNVVALRA